jgi:hypothetical protein
MPEFMKKERKFEYKLLRVVALWMWSAIKRLVVGLERGGGIILRICSHAAAAGGDSHSRDCVWVSKLIHRNKKKRENSPKKPKRTIDDRTW